MFDDVLVNGFNERIVRHGLHEDRTVVMTRRCSHIHLQGQMAVLLKHFVVNVLNGFEPSHLRIMYMMRFIVEDGELLDFTDNLAEVCFAVGGLATGLGPKGERK